MVFIYLNMNFSIQMVQLNIFSGNYFTDSCLTQAGGKAAGTINFYQMHTYSWNSAYNPSAPFKSPVSYSSQRGY